MRTSIEERRQHVGRLVPAQLMLAMSLVAACGEELPTTSTFESGVYRDGDDWAADNGAHPQVIRVFKSRGAKASFCTAWLSSSNTMTFNAHCLQGGLADGVGWQYDQNMRNSNNAQFAALVAMGASVGASVHPNGFACFDAGDDCCWGADLAVLHFGSAFAVPRTVMRPLAIKAASTEEPECDGDDRCIMMVGAGATGDDCHGDDPGPLDSTATQLFAESGLGDGHCPVNDEMVYGEYDVDDSSGCPGDSGSPIFWRGTDEVMAVNRGVGGDGGDDQIAAVLWAGGSETARDWFLLVAGDQDQDGIQAAHDNCDRTPNANQADFNNDTIGDACQDSDGDGILDATEISAGTDPAKGDTDADGLSDSEEATAGTNPKDSDSDDDGLLDGAEVKTHHTNPRDADSDDDGLSDGAEVSTYGTNPLDADSDDDALSDGAEVSTYGTNPRDDDSDDDRLTDGTEVLSSGTNPLDSDTDDDNLSDGQEVIDYNTNPLDPDTDDDLLNDGLEVTLSLDPVDADTDDDGLIDGKDTDWIIAYVNALPVSVFRASGSRDSITYMLQQVQTLTKQGKVSKARVILASLRTHLDGCGTQADATDWIIDCAEQAKLRALVDLLGTNL